MGAKLIAYCFLLAGIVLIILGLLKLFTTKTMPYMATGYPDETIWYLFGGIIFCLLPSIFLLRNRRRKPPE